jgi:hypothetical protein
MRFLTKRGFALALTAIVAGGIAVGGVVAARIAGPGDPNALFAAIGEAPVVRVADIGGAAGTGDRGVFVQATATGHLCLWDAPSASSQARRGGCNSIDDPLGGAKLSASLAYEGGPAARQVTSARLIGLVSLGVASVQVLMSDGTRRAVPMRRQAAVASVAGSFRAFGYAFAVSDLERGLGPIAVLALDSRGVEIDRQTTGFGG